MTEYRCLRCKGLLFFGSILGKVEIKCRKCDYINKIDKIGPFTIVMSGNIKEGEWILKTV